MNRWFLILTLIISIIFSACGILPDGEDVVNMSFATYAEKNFYVGGQDSYPEGIAFSSDGTKMYMVGSNGKKVYQYTLSSGWDVSTASYASKYADVSGETSIPRGVNFNSDGTKMYVLDSNNTTVYQYALSVAWDVSTATYDSKSFSVGSQLTFPVGFAFKSDGSKMYVTGTETDKVFQYNLSSSWDVSTATYASKSLDLGSINGAYNLGFNTTGQNVYFLSSYDQKFYEYKLSTAWDISSATSSGRSLDVSSEDVNPRYMTFDTNRTKLYMSGGNEKVYQYTVVETTIVTKDATNILTTSATLNGEISAMGVENVTTRGFKYGLTKTDTWDAHDDGDYGIGVYDKGIIGLSTNTTYWFRAYFTDSVGTTYGDWVQFQTAAEGAIPTGTLINICSDYSGYTYKLMRSETDDGEEYTAYFVISTDLTNKQGLAYYKRILDLWLYFNKEDSGSANVYVKRDSEPDWQTVGTVTLTGTDDIVIKHLAPDIRGKHFLFKISASNPFEFLGCLFESIKVGMR